MRPLYRKAHTGLMVRPCTIVRIVPKTYMVHRCRQAASCTVPQRTHRRSGHVAENRVVTVIMAKHRKSGASRPHKRKRPEGEKGKDGLMPPRARPFNKEEIGLVRKISDKDNWRRKDGWGDRVTEAMFKSMRKKSDERAKRTGRKYSDFQLLMEVYEYKKKNKFTRLKY